VHAPRVSDLANERVVCHTHRITLDTLGAGQFLNLRASALVAHLQQLPAFISEVYREADLPRYLAGKWRAILLVCSILALAIAIAIPIPTGPKKLLILVDRDVLPADGFAVAHLSLRASNGERLKNIRWRIESGQRLGELNSAQSEAQLRAGVTPGTITVFAIVPGSAPVRTNVALILDSTDEFGDGTPDFLRLQNQADQTAFRRWFTFLAESPYFQPEKGRPSEVTDCAALIRFAYREALRRHDAGWAKQWHLPTLPNVGSVQKYDYPHTALGPALFRIHPGAFAPEDLSSAAFREFADADSLRRYNTHFISRDVHAAQPGDLLFFRQQEHRMPFHSMIYLGASNFDGSGEWLIYHTGPSAGRVGELRRVTVTELLAHPEFCWRPLPQNPSFLGVYRWNILREEE
jgi:uncharacterized protein